MNNMNYGPWATALSLRTVLHWQSRLKGIAGLKHARSKQPRRTRRILIIVMVAQVLAVPLIYGTSSPSNLSLIHRQPFRKQVVRSNEVRALDFSPDGRWLATAHESGGIQLWEVETLEPVHQLEGVPA